MENEFEELETRLKFIRQVIPREDMGEFIDLLLQMNCVLAYSLQEFANLETVCEIHPEVTKVFKNLRFFRLKMENNDTRVLDLQKFALFD
jgi:hypothetical protein